MSATMAPIHTNSKPQARRDRPETDSERPLKRRRRWCDTVEWCALAKGMETDARRIAQRQKQVDFGKNTIAYDRFIADCPRETRKKGDPMTPLVNQKCSKRSFMGQVTSWKKRIYTYVADMDERKSDECVQKLGDGFKLDGGAGARSATGVMDRKGGSSCTPSVGNSAEAITDDRDIELSDLDDIEIDDYGNLITKENDPSQVHEEQEQEPVKSECSSSIFAPL